MKVLSGYHFPERKVDFPMLSILCPLIGDVQLEIDRDIYKLDECWFGLDYGIYSINLPYALLYLKLDFGANINLITLPPTKRNYRDPCAQANLLDFLDEIGCNVYVNPDLHAELILSNDLALIGTFNLLMPALDGREEIGISVDDMDDLNILENYARDVTTSSSRYGVAIDECQQHGLITTKVTRGWLFGDIVRECFAGGLPEFHEFLFFYFGTIYANDLLKKVVSDLEAFYVKALLAYLNSKSHSGEQRLRYLRYRFNYQGKNEIGEILDFLGTKLARAHVPKVPLKIISMPKWLPSNHSSPD